MSASALLLLLACFTGEQQDAPAAASPALLSPEPSLPLPQHTLTVTRRDDTLTVDGRTCPGAPEAAWTVGDLTLLCIDPAQLDAEGAKALITSAPGAIQVALYPDAGAPWPLWFFGAEVTLVPSDTPLRDERGGMLGLGVQDRVTIARGPGWTQLGGGWVRDDLPLGDALLLRPRNTPAQTFTVPHPEIIWKLAAEVADGAGPALLNGGSLTDTQPLPLAGNYTLYNPPTSLLRAGENRIAGARDVGLSGHIGAEVVLDWRHGEPAEHWQVLRFSDDGWAAGDAGRHRRARLDAPEAAVGTQVWLDGPGRVWLNGVPILAVETAGRGQVPDGVWAAGDNLLAVEAAPGVRASLWRY